MEGEKSPAEDQMRMKWESLHQEFSTKQKLLQNVLEQEQEQVVSNILLFYINSYKRCTTLLREYNYTIIYIFINSKTRHETNDSSCIFLNNKPVSPNNVKFMCENLISGYCFLWG